MHLFGRPVLDCCLCWGNGSVVVDSLLWALCVWSLFRFTELRVLSGFADSHLFFFFFFFFWRGGGGRGCFASVTVDVVWVPWVGLQQVIFVLPDHTHLLFGGRLNANVIDYKNNYFENT